MADTGPNVSDRRGTLLGGLKDGLSQVGADISEMARVRWQLAELEVRRGLGAAKRLAIALTIATVCLLSSVPVLVVGLAHVLSRIALAPGTWLLIQGLALAVFGGLIAWAAWQRFRREYAGLRETLEEFREDIAWLREAWPGQGTERAGERGTGD